ncbi:MAG: succinyldiaminopimelate transaminase [Burkholderiales bacterium]|nr:succinyldiaminopimelate transaminase [Burkholderiales bacterium]
MNPDLARLQPYPFQRLAALCQGVTPNPAYFPIKLSIGEPQHETPAFIRDALARNLGGLSHYPTTQGSDALRESIAGWLKKRYRVALDGKTQILPVNGSREALFAFAHAVVDSRKPAPAVICPNPFYQIYEGAALLAGATPHFLNTTPENRFALDFDQIPASLWENAQLLYLCSPANPTGRVMSMEEWEQVFDLSDKHGFVIASDECYSEIYFDDPPLGSLEAAKSLCRHDFRNLVMFSSLSKRSNVPGMRSGFVAGNADILQKFLLYRTYHGCAMNPAVQFASTAAWQDEAHVLDNRIRYRAKFEAVMPILRDVLQVEMPDAGFYLWARTPISDTEFAQALYRDYNVLVLPGSYLARDSGGMNPGRGFVRIALVAPLEQCIEAAGRIGKLCSSLSTQH